MHSYKFFFSRFVHYISCIRIHKLKQRVKFELRVNVKLAFEQPHIDREAYGRKFKVEEKFNGQLIMAKNCNYDFRNYASVVLLGNARYLNVSAFQCFFVRKTLDTRVWF